MARPGMTPRERLVFHVQELERVEELKRRAAECVKESYEAARVAGFDMTTLKVVLKLRKMTPDQRRERRALESVYMAALGMLEGDPLSDEARRRLDGEPKPEPTRAQESKPASKKRGSDDAKGGPSDATRPAPETAPTRSPQPPLILKTPDEARAEGAAAADAGKRIYDNPYPAGDVCRAAWDEGWCAHQKSHGMETPAAYQRRSAKTPETGGDKHDQDEKRGGASDLDKKGAA